MALRDLLNKSKYQEPMSVTDSAPTLAIKIGKKLFGDKTTTRTLPNGGGTYQSPTVGVQAQPEVPKDYSGLYGTNQNYQGSGGFNYATQQAADNANIQQGSDDSEYANLLNDSGAQNYTPTTDLQYTMNKINETIGTQDPATLFSMRQRLARDQALASVGQLPTDNAQNPVFDGLGITQGAPSYDYGQRMAVNKATSDIYSPQINAIDDLIKAQKDNKDGTNSSILQQLASSSDPMDKVILNIANKETTIEKRALAAQQLKAQAGDTASIVQNIVNTYSPTQASEYNALVTSGNNYQSALDYVSQNPTVTTGFLKNNGQKIIRLANKTGDPKYLALKALVENAEQPIRKEFFGVAVSSGESAKAEQAMTSSKDTIEAMLIKVAIKKAITQANIEVGPLMQKAPTNKDIQAAYKKVYTDQLTSIANSIKAVSPTAYNTISGMIPKQTKTTTTQVNQSSGNSYGGLL